MSLCLLNHSSAFMRHVHSNPRARLWPLLNRLNYRQSSGFSSWPLASRDFAFNKESLCRHEISFNLASDSVVPGTRGLVDTEIVEFLMKMNARTSSHACGRLSEAEWRQHCPSFSALTFADKVVLLRQGDDCDYVFYIAKGRVKLSRMNQRGDQFTLVVLTQGQLFGATLSDEPREAFPDTAEAKGRTILYRVQLIEFKRFLASQPALAWDVLGIFSKGQRVLERKLELLMFHDVRSRLVETLRDLAGSHGGNCAHGFELDIKLTQQELADLVGATRPVVSTILNEFKAHGILDYHRTLICIQDLKALK